MAEIVALDDMSDPIRAASLGRQMAGDSSVAAIIGSYQDETSLSLALVAASSGLPLICPTSDTPGLDQLGPLVHVLNRTDPAMVASLAEFAVRNLGLHTFAVLANDDERGRVLARSFADRVTGSGGIVVSRLNYPGQESNFENQMNLLQRYLPDALYLTAKSEEITQIASQVYYYGLQDLQLLGGEHWDSERVIRLGGEYVNGGVFASSFYEQGEGLNWNVFKSHYEQIYRRPVNRYSAWGYDAAGLILAAAGRMPVSRRGLSARLNETRGFSGTMGLYSVDEAGRVHRKVFILQLSAGEVVPARSAVENQPPADSTGGERQAPAENRQTPNQTKPGE